MEAQKDNILKTGTLKKSGGSYTLFLQTAANIDEILALQDRVFSSLTAEEQSFLLRKDRAFFEAHFRAGSPMLGILHEGRLVAQSVITNPTAAFPKTGMTDMALDVPTEKLTIMQGVVVDPAYRGNRLMTLMADAWLDIAQKQGRTVALAEVAADNFHSWSVFLKEGLHIHSIGVDPADGTQLYNISARVAPLIRRRLRGDFNKAAGKRTAEVPQADLEGQKKLLSQGYKGVDFDPAKMNIVFAKPKRKKADGAKP